MATRTACTAGNGTLEQGSGHSSSRVGPYDVGFPQRAADGTHQPEGVRRGPLVRLSRAGTGPGHVGGVRMRCTGNGRPPAPPQPRPNGR